ncbi:TetR/AcrR family transcriptional regulator [Flavitalea sp. BT771]|uniref:TetR/AcrR family transcriptional regulator n=1 Tax=Flavitalea sp. BT771 TaxID=3063329 RepID=UPI0026E4552B|nr:TetR/AcrR family transcriptional regulator [Flavitalea sp. BT771]MDO6429925.1 TetR/AcrR family transcriptional regulator [Flavitalea sp. BT771]MDV6217947.1 TetR/AcrR family transcriptional regulator [Flavitalea sp. BT771]
MAKANRPSRGSRPSVPKKRPAPRKRPTPQKRRATGKAPSAAADLSTEEKIMQAAKKLFTQNGFAATRTRDIAKEAGINLALLNYYFRSKEKLFDIVMTENFRQFIRGISFQLLDDATSVQEKIQRIVTAYIDFLNNNPDLPIFIINEIRGNTSKVAQQIQEEVAPIRAHMFRQLQEAGRQGEITPIDPFHFMANLIGLTVFPFIGRPILQRVTGVNDQQFRAFMEERKNLVPIWINAIMHSKK